MQHNNLANKSGTSQKCNKKCWVSAIWIIRVTGWHKEELRQARRDKVIAWRKDHGRPHEYDLNSIPERLLIYSNILQSLKLPNNG